MITGAGAQVIHKSASRPVVFISGQDSAEDRSYRSIFRNSDCIRWKFKYRCVAVQSINSDGYLSC